MANMLDNLGEKSIASLTEIFEELLEQRVRHEAEVLRAQEALTRAKEKVATNELQQNLIRDELATRNPVI